MKTLCDTKNGLITFKKGVDFCVIDTKVKTYKYDNGSCYYYITYTNTYSGEDTTKINSSHPFYNNKYSSHLDGDIIFKNYYSQELINILFMTKSQLIEYLFERTSNSTVASIPIQTFTIRFKPLFCIDSEDIDNMWCDITLNIETIVYKNTYIYKITYTYNPNKSQNHNHDFYKKYSELTKKTHFIVKNPLTTQLIKLLLTPNDKLSLICGSCIPINYKFILLHFINSIHKEVNPVLFKKKIMKHICKLWD